MSLTSEEVKTLVLEAMTAVLDTRPQSSSPNSAKARVKTAERPEIDVGSNEDQWEFFLHEWDLYKRRTLLEVSRVSDELRACCTKDLRKVLFDFVGGTALDGLSEPQLLKQIKVAAVVGKNTAVHRKEFHAILQAPGETINAFVAKLKSKAERCNFKIECAADACRQVNSYAEAMVSDQMVAGLYDKEIQQDVLAKGKDLPTFDARYNFIEAQELGRVATTQLDGNQSSTNVMKSQYKKQQSAQKIEENLRKLTTKCSGCNSERHNSAERSTKCPAWGKTCYNCGKNNHFSRCCSQQKLKKEKISSTANVMQSSELEERSYFLGFSSETSTTRVDGGDDLIPHVEWDGERFVRAKPEPLPSLPVVINPMVDGHNKILKADGLPTCERKCDCSGIY